LIVAITNMSHEPSSFTRSKLSMVSPFGTTMKGKAVTLKFARLEPMLSHNVATDEHECDLKPASITSAFLTARSTKRGAQQQGASRYDQGRRRTPHAAQR
jgi:tyrosine-protein phosphatase YwqE